MKSSSRIVSVMGLMIAWQCGSLMAAESNQRVVRPGAEGYYQTIQAALDEALPGDVVVISGGLYHEHLTTQRAGEPERPITVRAALNQSVLIRPGQPLAGAAQPVAGSPDLFRWPAVALREACAADELGFWEANTRLRLRRTYALAACEKRLGSWYYDEEQDDLYIRSTGIAPAAELIYIREEVTTPVFAVCHPHIVIENLGFAFGAHGVHIDRVHDVTVRGCHAWCNRSAGIYGHGDRLYLTDNVLHHNNQYGIQLRRQVHHSRILRNHAFLNGPNNGERTDTSVPADISLFSRSAYNLFEGNIIEGQHQNAYRNKYGGNNSNIFRGNVVKGFFDCAAPCIENNTIIATGLGPRFGIYVDRVVPDTNPDPERCDPGGHQRRTNLIHPVIHAEDPLFADPAWSDYRLQLGSPYHGKGARPADETVLYVDPVKGDDTNHGRSLAAPLRTLTQVAALVHPDYTVYLLPGVHETALQLTLGGLSELMPLRFRAYGKSDKVILTGGLEVRLATQEEANTTQKKPFARIGPRHIRFEGLVFKGMGVHLANATDIEFSGCVWDVPQAEALKIEQCSAITVDRGTFVGAATAVVLAESSATRLARTLFNNSGVAVALDTESLASLQSWYNAWCRPEWLVADEKLAELTAWQKAVPLTTGELSAAVELNGNFALPLNSSLMFAADDFGHIGARTAPADDLLEIRNLRVAGVVPTAVSLLWETPRGVTESLVKLRAPDGSERSIKPTDMIQIFGKYYDMSSRISGFYEADRHLVLADLQPDSEYEVEVTALAVGSAALNRRSLRFKTPAAAPEPQIYHVAPEGSDEADGLSHETAWRTLRRATATAGPGDRVRVWPGLYPETLRPRISGTAGLPLIFESVEPRQAAIDLMESLPVAVEIANLNHIEVVGFAIVNGKFPRGRAYALANARGIRVAGCEIRYPQGVTFERLRLGHAGLVAVDAPDLLIEDNVFLATSAAIGLARCSGALIRHNTILGEGNYGISIVPDLPEEEYTVEHNLFERPVMGYKTGSAIWLFNVRAKLNSDYNLYHIPTTHKGTVGWLIDKSYRSLAEWQAVSGLDQHSLEAQPLFVEPENGNFQLRPGSPGLKDGKDGTTIGIRW